MHTFIYWRDIVIEPSMFCYALQLRESVRMFYFRDISTCAVNVCDLVTFRSYVKLILFIFSGSGRSCCSDSCLANCNVLCMRLPLKLQLAQNAVALMLTEVCWQKHVVPVLQDLHQLPASFLVKHKVLELTPQMLRGLAPSYVQDVIFSLELAWPVWEKRISTAKLHGGEGD